MIMFERRSTSSKTRRYDAHDAPAAAAFASCFCLSALIQLMPRASRMSIPGATLIKSMRCTCDHCSCRDMVAPGCPLTRMAFSTPCTLFCTTTLFDAAMVSFIVNTILLLAIESSETLLIKPTVLSPAERLLQLQPPDLDSVAARAVVRGWLPAPCMYLLHNAHDFLAVHRSKADLFLLLFHNLKKWSNGFAGW